MTNEITVFEQFKTDLAVFKEHNAELSFNFDLPEEEEACRAHHRKLRKLWNGIEKLKLKTTEVLRDEVADTNTEAKAIQAEVDLMADPFKAQMDAKDAEIQKEIDALAEANRLKAEYDTDENLAWLEYRERKAQSIIDAADESEREKKAEAAKLVIAETATKAAEAQAAKEAKDALDKAEKEKQDAVAKAKKEAADAIVAEKNKQDEIRRKEAERVADVKHRRKIEHAIYTEIVTIVGDMDYAQKVVDEIKSGRIPHIKIVY
jgi:hypothetical protein